MSNKEQMELGFNGAVICRVADPKQRRRNRAQWWFKQMRRAVDCAMEWEPSPSARAEQVHIKLAPRW
ncbi:MAG: hypothetical protein ABIQ35_15955 [Verrucomicrobiota bacterium]